MADLTSQERSSPVQVVGGGTSDEANLANVTGIKELSTSDILDNAWTTSTLTVGTTAVELKVGAFAKTDRKTVFFQLLSSGMLYWGFSNSNTPFIAFKYQTTAIAVGDGTSIWLKGSEAGRSVAIGEA